ncbi:nitrogen regulatory protein PII [Cytobacillus eiseniae]|uniref:Nitrogen regulatory protein PII n=1 Tax=Cytobacillus eiseniae TaxID=762947 RepID=A0ABS4RH13_9BACI|nr:P-II family nitrogen regulator [Cytobacillus eiseniae]MBP2242187.1 nitrogen regulatory protein PII [Cytobacillus eiseniae]
MNEISSKLIGQLNTNHKLLVTIVKKGLATKVVKASKGAGAKGGTILFGKGHGIHEKRTFLGFTIDSDKEVILTLMPVDIMEDILKAVEEAANLHKPSHGIGFVVDVKKLGGIAHMLHLYENNE